MNKFTRGPWKVFEEMGSSEDGMSLELCFHSIRDEHGDYIASTWSGPHEANAHLIAAAPEIYSALENMISAFEYDGQTEGENIACYDAREALAKARGEK